MAAASACTSPWGQTCEPACTPHTHCICFAGSAGAADVGHARRAGQYQRREPLGSGSSAGTLLRGMQARDLQLTLDGNSFRIASLEARWNPFSLLSGTFVLDSLHLQGLLVDWTSAPGPATAPLGTDPFAAVLPLPMALNLMAFTLDQATLTVDGQVQQIEHMALTASLDGCAPVARCRPI